MATTPKLPTTNFGLQDSLLLNQLRQLQRNAEDVQARSQYKGAVYAADVAGRGIGEALGRYFGKDPEMQRAQLVDSIIATARNSTNAPKDDSPDAGYTMDEAGQAAPSPERPKDPWQQRIDQGNVMADLLDAHGLTTEADQVRQGVLSLYESQSKQRSREADIESKTVAAEAGRQNMLFNKLGTTLDVTLRNKPELGVMAVQQLHDGTITYIDPESGQQSSARPGQYIEVTPQGSINQLTPDKVQARAFNTRLNGANTAIRLATELREQIRQDPSAASFGTQIASKLAVFGTQARSLLQGEYGQKLMDDNSGKLERFFKERNITDTVFKARASNLAYAIATSREGGRLTDQDVERAATAAGLNNATPEARIAALDDYVLGTIDDMKFASTTAQQQNNPAYLGGFQTTIGGFNDSRKLYSVPIPGRDPVTDVPNAEIRQQARDALDALEAKLEGRQ